MALEKSYTALGTEFASAYHRIKNVYYSKKAGNVIRLEIYTDSTAAAAEDSSKLILENVVYNMDFDSECTCNCLTECYTYLKTLADYNGAQDV